MSISQTEQNYKCCNCGSIHTANEMAKGYTYHELGTQHTSSFCPDCGCDEWDEVNEEEDDAN